MTKVVVLRLIGDLESDIWVTFEWRPQGQLAEGRITTQLAPNPKIAHLYSNWQQRYLNLEYIYRNPRLKPRRIYLSSKQECEEFADELNKNLNQWLNSNHGFRRIRDKLAAQLRSNTDRNTHIRVMIQTDNPQLQRLPWHLWDFWNDHDSVEITLSPLEYETITANPPNDQVRVLAILGNSEGIDIEPDKQHLQELIGKDSLLEFLVKPTREQLEASLRDALGWHILFFAGHSSSERKRDRMTGRIYINDTDSLTIDELKHALKTAINNGLKLAIFNSCDGLGLGNALAELQIPQVIIMKEPIPDQVAHKFLEFFLTEFTQRKPLEQAVRVARQRLESIQHELPYATWLPVIYQHPTAKPWCWPVSESLESSREELSPVNRLIKLALATVALVGIYGIYKLAIEPNKLGDKISSGEEILDTTSAPRFKQRGVELVAACQTPWRDNLAIFSQKNWQRWQKCWWSKTNYQDAVNFFSKSWQEEDKDPETLIYLNNALLDATKSDYYTIAVAVPIVRNKDGSVKNRELAQEILRGIAHAQTEVNLELFQDNDKLPGKDILNGKSIKGKGLKVIIADDANIPSEAIQRAKALVKERNIYGVVGHYASDMTIPTVDIYNTNKLVLISSGSTTEELTEHPRDFFLRTVASAKIEAQSLVDYLVENGHQKAAGFYNPESPFTHSFWQEFKQQFTNQGGEIVNIKHDDISKQNFNAKQAIEEIRQTQETAIVLIPDGQVTNAVTNAIDMIKENNRGNVIVGSSGMARSKTLALENPDLFEKFVVSVPWHHLNSANPQVTQDAQTLWGKSFNSLTFRSALAYDTTRVLITAIEKQNNPTRLGMQKTLRSPDFSADGLTGKIEFEPANGNRKNPSRILVHVVPCPNQDHGLEFVPLEYSSCDYQKQE
ncbi:ABC transporter substrate-binding protein [Moorena sp. SIO3H5]|uniref:ABC transporter substrate-binding protein n=1 Tax=Moorena sp. SIO3H5 TaxID=2607834 RepID=UPI0013B7F6A6|nr:ABC transporter substrate-binding protein [Moorena sp. SIO3H5]NEO68878.1 ABC transporter substrate-binding protein [Moorena sp. SIO3H5]